MSRESEPLYAIDDPDIHHEMDAILDRTTPELEVRVEKTARERGTTVSKPAWESFERLLAP